MKANPAYPNTPLIQQAVTAWSNSADGMEKNDHDTKATKVTLAGLITSRRVALAEWKRSTRALLAAIDQVSVGSAKSISDWGFPVAVRAGPVVPSTSPPQGLRVTYDKKTLDLVIRWSGVRANIGYQLQIGDGSATPVVFGATITTTQTHFRPTGLVVGQHVAIRLAVQRRTGLSTWSDTVTAVVR